MTDNNGAGSIDNSGPQLLGPDWVLALLGARTLLGKRNVRSGDLTEHLTPVYQLDVRAQPQQAIDPKTKQPVMVMTRPRFISAVCEMDGFDSVELPDAGCVVKPLSELPLGMQKQCAQLVADYENARSAVQRKQRIDEEAAKAMSFGGGARRD